RDQRVLVPRVQVLTYFVAASSLAFFVETLAALLILITGLLILALHILMSRISRTSAQASQARRQLTSSVAEFLEGKEELEFLGAEIFAEQRFQCANEYEQKMAVQHASARSYYVVACTFIAASGSYFAAGLLGADTRIAALAAAVIVLGAGEALGLWMNSSLAKISSMAAESSIDQLPGVLVKSHEVPLARDGNYLLEAENISVSGLDGECLLQPFSVSLETGSFTAIVGPSGAGKSTLLAALGGLAELSSGSVSIHGVDLSQLSDEARSKLVAFVGHEDGILSGTVRDLLSMGRRDLEDAVLEQALEQVGLASSLRDRAGLETTVASSGGNFSTGERRRLVLARAIATTAPIWLLDEPCAGLDPRAAEALVAMIASLGSSRAIVMVTHRDEEAGLANKRWQLAHGLVQHAS
ncbi:MAG: ATP-binding cassette domain-containing protein, partial [Actinomycetes bacterium]